MWDHFALFSGPQEDLVPVKGVAPDDIAPTESADAEHTSFELEDFQVIYLLYLENTFFSLDSVYHFLSG